MQQFSSLLAAFTAERAAERIAEITPDCPARIPARRPAMALSPADRRVLLVRLAFIAVRTLEATVLPVLLML